MLHAKVSIKEYIFLVKRLECSLRKKITLYCLNVRCIKINCILFVNKLISLTKITKNQNNPPETIQVTRFSSKYLLRWILKSKQCIPHGIV